MSERNRIGRMSDCSATGNRGDAIHIVGPGGLIIERFVSHANSGAALSVERTEDIEVTGLKVVD